MFLKWWVDLVASGGGVSRPPHAGPEQLVLRLRVSLALCVEAAGLVRSGVGYSSMGYEVLLGAEDSNSLDTGRWQEGFASRCARRCIGQ